MVIVHLLHKSGNRARLEAKARDLRQHARYAATFTEAGEVSAGVAKGGIPATLNLKRQRQLVERPATLSSSIHAFRSFIQQVPATTGRAVVLAIDELDKLDDPEKAVQLLRNIKALFDIEGVNVIVSISDEAAKHLELGAVSGRNEFNSTFGKVIHISGLPTGKGLKLSHQQIEGDVQEEDTRDEWQEEEAAEVSTEARCALTALSGGVPRELARMSEIMYSRFPDSATGEGAAVTLVLHEANAFVRELLNHDAAGDGGSDRRVSEGDKLAVYKILGRRDDTESDRLKRIASSALMHWTPPWASHAWMSAFGEQWRRLLVRAIVASLFFRPADERLRKQTEELQEIISIVYLSSHVGLERLFCYLLSQVVSDGSAPQLERWSSLLLELFTTSKVNATVGDVDGSDHVTRGEVEKLSTIGVLVAADEERREYKLVPPQVLVQTLQPALR